MGSELATQDSRDGLLALLESVRDLGRGALRAEAVEMYTEARWSPDAALHLDAALDIFDRQLDHIVGYVVSHGATAA